MKKIKIILDIIMTIIMLLLMKVDITGLKHHEILGIGVFILFIIHKILNFKWVKAVGKNIFNNNMKMKSRVMFILDCIMFIFMALNVITGIGISKTIFTNMAFSNIEQATMLHYFFTWWSLILVSIHIGLHWGNFVKYLQKKFKILENKLVKIIFIILYLIIMILGIWSLSKSSVYTKLVPIVTNTQEIQNGQQYKERNYKNQKSNQNNSINKELSESNNSSNIPSLEEYLSQFNCDGCRRRCSLLRPGCPIGDREKEEKTQEYYELYKNTEKQNNNIVEKNTDRKYKNKTSIVNVIWIMIMFIGGTYYINEIIEDKGSKEKK